MKKKNLHQNPVDKTVPLDHFQRYKIILESVDTILYPHTNLYPTLYIFKKDLTSKYGLPTRVPSSQHDVLQRDMFSYRPSNRAEGWFFPAPLVTPKIAQRLVLPA